MIASAMTRHARWVVSAAVVTVVTLVTGTRMVAMVAPASVGDAEASAPSQRAPTVFAGHPRLIVGGYRGATVPQLEAACAHADMRGECERIGGRHLLDDAMAYLLSDDDAAAGRARAKLLAGLSCSDGYEHSAAGGYALAYDWVWGALSAGDRTRVEGTLAECGSSIARSLRSNSPHLWHGFTSQASALALVALALDEHPARETLLADAAELFRQRSLEAYEVTGGAWPEGYSYMRTHFFSSDPPYQYVIDALRAWDSAVEQDHPDHASLFETIAAEEGDWLRGLAYHTVYGTVPSYASVPKLTLLRGGDMPTGQAYPSKQYRPFMDAIARIYDDALLKAWGEALENDWPFVGGSGTYHPIHRYGLPYNLPTEIAFDALESVPAARVWGRDDLGYVLVRPGLAWGGNPVLVSYRAGKWFTGHQHMDQGHFDIWHAGPLAIDSGVYASWGSEHREGYYARAVAHNTILVHRDGESFEQHPGLGEPVNDDGQRIHTHNRRGCAQCMQSVDEWRSHIGDGQHLEAGRIEAFETDRWATVVHSELAGAYNSTAYSTPGNEAKVDLVQRDLVHIYLNDALSALIVADRVRTTPGSGLPRFTLHAPTRPEIEGLSVVSGTPEDGVLSSSARAFLVDNGSGGVLVGKTLLPGETRVTAIGGTGHRYWVDGKNRIAGASGLEGAPAEPGSWRIEVAPASADEGSPLDTLLLHTLLIGDSFLGQSLAGTGLVASRMNTDPAAPEPALMVRGFTNTPAPFVVLSGGVPRAPVRYASLRVADAPLAESRLTLTDLVPGATYRIAPDLDPDNMEIWEMVSSEEGVLVTSLARVGNLAFGVCPEPVGAGEDWQRLCRAEGAPTRPAVTPDATPAVSPTASSSPTTPAPTPTAGHVAARCYLPLTEAAMGR